MSLRGFFNDLLLGGACRIRTGSASPEGAETAGVGSLYLRTTSGSPTVYTKQTGTGNTGWAEVGMVQRATVTLTDAQIKALPTTGISIVAAPGSGFRVKPMACTWKSHIAVAYTNLNTTYAALNIETATAPIVLTTPIVNDSTTTPALTDLTSFLTTAQDNLIDVACPAIVGFTGYVAHWNGVPAVSSAFDNRAAMVRMDNNGSGNLTAGNAANTLLVTFYYAIEVV